MFSDDMISIGPSYYFWQSPNVIEMECRYLFILFWMSCSLNCVMESFHAVMKHDVCIVWTCLRGWGLGCSCRWQSSPSGKTSPAADKCLRNPRLSLRHRRSRCRSTSCLVGAWQKCGGSWNNLCSHLQILKHTPHPDNCDLLKDLRHNVMRRREHMWYLLYLCSD